MSVQNYWFKHLEMIVLGICESHGSSACLMVDGEIVGLVMEERLTHRKNQVAFPRRAIAELVEEHLDGDARRIDEVVFAEHRINPFWIMVDRYSEFGVHDHVREQHELWKPYFYAGGAHPDEARRATYHRGEFVNQDHNHDFGFVDHDGETEAAIDHFSVVERPAAMLRHFGWKGPVRTIEHHACHAYYALYGQQLSERQYLEALVFTADAWGETSNWSVSTTRPDGRLEVLASGSDNLLARIYKFSTLVLGMKPNEHEYKVMGLAAYGRAGKYVDAVKDIYAEILDFRDGAFVQDRPLADSYFDLKNRLEGHRFDNIAAGLQAWCSEVTQKWMRHWIERTERSVVCFSGGLAMNIKANGDILDMPEVSFLSIPASGGDESLSAGACFGAWVESDRRPIAVRQVYLGSEAQMPDDWQSVVRDVGHDAEAFALMDWIGAAEIAKLLAANCIVARCCGRGEFGARALGNRSILANPANESNIKTINDAIKSRDFWMPFTPSILAEHADRYIANPKGMPSPFMTIGFETKPAALEEIPAALHPADRSARPQFVERETNPGYWALIEAFRSLTGIAGVLNTSLNLHGEPMNYTVADAIRTVALSELDFLALPGDRLLYKLRASKVLEDNLTDALRKAV